MIIHENIPISELTTMRLGGAARYVIDVTSEPEIPEAIDFAYERNLSIWLMGGGANTIGRDEGFEGVIVRNRIKGIEVVNETADELILKAYGGEVWDDLVDFACARGYSGIEAMSKIPGTVGAAPVQNIGAYGQDLAQVLTQVYVYDLRENKFVVLPKDELKMTYRHTVFNYGEDKGRYFIIAIEIRLTKEFLQPPFYNSLQRYIDDHHEDDFSPANIRSMVSTIRDMKLPDPLKQGSAGSFFKNIYVDKVGADDAETKGIPVWRNEDGSGKINSGWLVEQSGLKGRVLHGFRVSEQAALVLINESATTYAELDAARQEIINTVQEKFGYALEQEPVELVAEDIKNGAKEKSKPVENPVEK